MDEQRARALLKASNLPKMLWPQAMSTVVYVYNRLPSPGNTRHEYKTPYELLYGTVPDISHLRIFGCDAYAYNFDISRQNWIILQLREYSLDMMINHLAT